MLSSSLAMPRNGHLQQVYHIFGYLKKYHNAEMVFDPSNPIIDPALFTKEDLSHTQFSYLNIEEAVNNMTEMTGFGFVFRAYVALTVLVIA